MTGTAEFNTSALSQHPGILFVPDGRVLSLNHVSVGILTALPKEYAAVCEVLQCSQEVVAMRDGSDKVYRLGVVREQAGERGIVVAVALLIDMGNVPAAARATNMVNDCPNLKEIIVCGIAGGIPNPSKPDDHVRVGDIVVSGDGVLQYDFGKQVPNGFQIKGGVRPPSANLLLTARSLQADELSGKRPWEQYIDFGLCILDPGFARPAASTDVLREQNWSDLKRLCSNVLGNVEQWLGRKPSYPPIPHPNDALRNRNLEQPRIFHGLIASASRILKDQTLRERLRRDHNAKAVEMETAGAAHAAYTGRVGYFVVRGTCDYCNLDKNDVWHCYAALAAAAYTRALLEATDVRVFAAAPKVLVIVEPIAPALQPHEDTQAALPEDYVKRALSEAKKAGADSGEIQSVGVGAGISRTSEAIRQIPRFGTPTVETSSQPDLSGLHASLLSDALIAEPVRYTGKAFVGGTLPGTTTPEQEVHAAPTAQPSEREQQLLASEGERQLSELKELLEKWEFNGAFTAASFTADWIATNEAYLPSKLASQMYSMLVRVEATKVKQSEQPGKKADLTKARYYLRKAKDVPTR